MKYFVYLVSLFVLMTSCSDDLITSNDNLFVETNNSNLNSNNYYKFYTSVKQEGSVLIQSNTTRVSQNINNNISFQEKPKTSKATSNNGLEIKGLNSKALNSKSYEDLFGSTVYYRIIDDSQNKTNDSYDNLYIPELLNIDISTEKIIPGTTISWNVDSLNENGVVVNIEYNAINQLNTKLAFNNISSVRKSFVIDDAQGSYTITQSDINIFPKNALLDINILRAGFEVDESTGLSISGVTKVGDTKYVNY